MHTPEHSKDSAGTLRKRLFFYLAAALFALEVGLMATISLTLLSRLKTAENQSLSHITEFRSIAVSEWCRRAKDIARQITSRTRIRQELEKYNNGDITLQQLDTFSAPKLRDAMSLSDQVIGIMRLDKNDLVVTHCGYASPLILKSYPGNNSYQITLSKPVTVGNRSVIIVSAPIVSRNGEKQGTDLVLIASNDLKHIVSNPDDLGKTSEIYVGYILDNGSVSLLFPQQGKDGMPHPQVNECIKKAVQGQTGFIDSGDTALAYHPIMKSNWGMVITQNGKELYRPIYTKMAVICGLSALVYIIILFGFWFFMKPLAGRILLHAHELERKIQEKTTSLEQEIIERKNTEKENQEIILQLRDAMQEIKRLSGMLPICSHCKKIRDDNGDWSHIESYIKNHSEAEFSHSICPECAKTHFPDIKVYKD